MHPKEIKAVLKEAREAIKSKKIKIAVEKCEEVLKDDPDNYMALLLMGAAYQEKDKKAAAKYLRQAVSCTNEPTFALQGLANCAEWEELPEIYKKLLTLSSEKYSEYHNKLVLASEYIKNLNDCVEILRNESKNSDELRQFSALKCLAKILLIQTEVPSHWEDMLKPSLKAAVDDKELKNHLDYCKRYLKHLYKLKDLELLVKEACCLTEEYPEQVCFLEWILKVYSENYRQKADIEKYIKKPIEVYADHLLQLTKNSSLGLLIKAINLFEFEQFVQARDLLQAIKEIQPNSVPVLEFLAHSNVKLGAYGIAAIIFKQLDKNSTDLAICLSYSTRSDNLIRAIDILNSKNFQSFDNKDIDAISSLVRSHFSLGQNSQAVEILDKLKTQLGENKIVSILEAEFSSSSEEALNILRQIEDCYFASNLLKGKIYFQENDFESALSWLLTATKQKPYYAECFLWLGKLYSARNDMVRARKCFEKCTNLNPHNEYASIHLSAMYRQNGDWDLNEALLQNALKFLEGKESKWVLYQLSLHNFGIKKYTDAIHFLRTTLRYDLKDIRCWEALADAYHMRGSYNSAMKVYEKVLEIDPENTYAKLQIAIAKLTLHMYKEAIDIFSDLLVTCPDYLPALKGAAEAHYGLANKLLTQRLLGRCKDHLQEATNYLQRAFLVGKRDMVWLWRMIANVFVMVACMPVSKAFLNVSGRLSGREEDIVILEGNELFEFATRFYTCSLKLQPEDALLWHELSLCYYKYGVICKDYCMTLKHFKLALDTSKQSIKIQPARWQNWNLLGVINATKEINDLAMAQHSFIQALQLERKSAVTWTNLGALYLSQNAIKLANQAFQKAQQSNPSFINAWIGQAIIAETICEDEEAMDLFRHCTQLDFHVESAIGYAHWVCSILSNPEKLKEPGYRYAIENMHAVPVALDSMNWYTAVEDINSSIASLSYFGYLNFKAQLWGPAIKAYKSAIKLAGPAEKDKLLCNLGYAYLKRNQCKDAIEAFNSVLEATLKSTTGLALAYFNDGQHEESYSIYKSALEWLAGSEAEKAVLLTAILPMIYASQGEADTKNVLYQCISLSNPPIQALFAACALGILHQDFQLSENILEELWKYESDPEYCHHIAFLTSQFYLVNKQMKSGLMYILRRVRIFPDNSLLRGILANYVLQNYHKSKRHLSAVCQIAQSTMILGLTDSRRKTSLKAAQSLTLASKAMRHVDRKIQLKLAQRALHVHPISTEAWVALTKSKS